MRKPKQHKLNDLSRSLTTLDVHHTLIAVIEMSLSSWLVAGIVPGVERQPLKKLDTDENALLKLLDRWRKEADRAGHKIRRIAVAFEAGRDGFWLARWLRAHGIEVHVIHASSVAVSRVVRKCKTSGFAHFCCVLVVAHTMALCGIHETAGDATIGLRSRRRHDASSSSRGRYFRDRIGRSDYGGTPFG